MKTAKDDMHTPEVCSRWKKLYQAFINDPQKTTLKKNL